MFRLALCLLPLLALLLLEGAFRLAGFGGYPPLFKRVGPTEHGELVTTDIAGAVSWFFANRDRPGYNDQYHFYEPKPTNTVRIVVVGESAVKGFPQPRHLAATAFLEAMLTDAWPGRRVEIVNLGTTAVASYPVLGMLTEALEFAPDLVVVYTGHNEFFGTYGVASIGRAGSRPWRLAATRWVNSLALIQAWDKFTARKPAASNRTLMEIMAGQTYIGPADPGRAAATNILSANLSEMVHRCQTRNVPVLLCTLPSNERDLAPIGVDRLEDLPAAKRTEFNRLFDLGTAAPASGPLGVVQHLTDAVAIHPDHARAWFELGRALDAVGQPAEARAAFQRARDLDTMPWRATSAANEVIRRVATEPGARLCDVEAAFHRASPPAGIGWELMDDHVHPTLRGQALIAETIVARLAEFPAHLRVSETDRQRLRDWESYARRLGDNRYDRYAVAHMMRVIFDVPFMRERNPAAYQRFNAQASALEAAEPLEIQSVMREYQTQRPHAGAKRPIAGMVGRVRLRQKRFAEALELYEIARRGVPEYTSWHLEYVYFALVCREALNGSLSEAERATARAAIREGKVLLRRGFSETGFTERHLGRLHQLRGEFAEAIPLLQAARRKLTGTDLVAADQALVVSFLKTGQTEQARALAADGAARAGLQAPMYQRMLEEIPRFEASPREAGTNAAR